MRESGKRGVLAVLVLAGVFTAAGEPEGSYQTSRPATDPLHQPLDQILDMYVRDGLVYYRALQIERARFDRYVAALEVPAATYERWSPPEQMAFWINAYNAFVLRTVIDHYPIRGGSDRYPADSIRQIPGAFDRRTHRAAGRAVTLDEIEHTILPAFADPRVQVALGRGAVGSPRLRSEAYASARLEDQLASATREFARDVDQIRIDRLGGRITVSPVIGWHEAAFVAAYGGEDAPASERSPIERAILALATPHLYPLERAFVEKGRFTISYHDFDWRLNDLTGGPPPRK